MPGVDAQSVREQIRAASDIVDVIGAVVPLKRAGANFVALCPFHKEKTPSFNVTPQKQIFHCFGCHKGGDVFTFVQEYEGIDFGEALRRLAERARIPLVTDQFGGKPENRYLKESLLEIHEQITMRWQTALATDTAGAVARDYLQSRGVSEEAVKVFRLGYAPDAWDDTVNWAGSKGYEPAQVEKAGLILRGDGDRGYYGRFRGRLMFPICDEQNRVIGFSGRILKKDEKAAKYVNTPETPIFTKGKVFFGLNKTKRALLDAQTAVICEGQLDLIACYMAGIENVVAPQGTALTSDHARILKRYVNEVVLCFDSDSAGHAAAVRVLDNLAASGLAIRVASLPAPHDPDSFIKAHGGAAFRELIDRAEGFYDFYLDTLCTENDIRTDKGRTTVVKAMSEAVHKTGSLVLMDTYVQKTALKLAVGADAMRSEFKRLSRAPAARHTRHDDAPTESDSVSRPNAQEFWLLKLALLHEEIAESLVAHLDPEWITHPAVREIISLIRTQGSEPRDGGPAAILSDVRHSESRNLITEILAESRSIPNPAQQIQDLVLRLRNRHLDARIQALNVQAGQSTLSDDQHLAIVKEQQDLRRMKREPLKELTPGA
ncbi:MAG: DNA primase [Verrucomicrobia bacterium]|nr:DNA primase [Verrucomicrobiota bacterium]